ncbi:putative monooxygenase [Podospora australis]|uniref:Monooxygenase n=1 Tax=Podospora australis TaxID=1536484 RepID=A0AAN7AD50_9PEZI|nr:putative monooxygenase [Podospora australis]
MAVDTPTPSAERVVPGSARVPPCPWPATATTPDAEIDAPALARGVIDQINAALRDNNIKLIADLFTEKNAYWRDHLALSWDLRTIKGRDEIQQFLTENDASKKLVKVELDDSSDWRKPQVANFAPAGEVKGVGFYVKFETAQGRGRGVVRLVEEGKKKGNWRIWAFFATLEELKGFEEQLKDKRAAGVTHGGMPGRKNWEERRREAAEFAAEGDKGPEVLVIGAGQSGLTASARLKMLGVSTLMIDTNKAVGDNWRKRYHQLVLHDPVWYDHMPYMPFPDFWPIFTPKDKLAEWFEIYVKSLELNVWMESQLLSSSWDEEKKEWTVTIKRSNGELRTFHPKHIIQCTGHSGKKYLPQIKGMEAFKGDLLCHSADFPGAKVEGKGKKAIVVGACNSSHDICQDYYEKGYEVVMVQRSSTCVVSNKAALKVLMAVLYEEGGPPVEDSDIWLWGWPSEIMKSLQVDLAKIQRNMDKDLLEGLEKAGFKTDKGVDEGGLFAKYLQRGGGYYIDVGMSQLIIDGKVKVKQGQEIVEVLDKGLKFADGTEIEADEIIFATGYENMRGTAKSIFGDELYERTNDIWGWDEEGEMRTIWKGSGHPGFWFHGGNLALTRYYSRIVALQVKGKLEGLYV